MRRSPSICNLCKQTCVLTEIEANTWDSSKDLPRCLALSTPGSGTTVDGTLLSDCDDLVGSPEERPVLHDLWPLKADGMLRIKSARPHRVPQLCKNDRRKEKTKRKTERKLGANTENRTQYPDRCLVPTVDLMCKKRSGRSIEPSS